MKHLHIFGEQIIDTNAVAQLKNCLLEDSIGVMTADGHLGYSHPIGGAIAYRNHISVSGVGFDIGCGNKAVKTNIKASDINVPKVMDEIYRRISFGVGRHNDEKIDDEVFGKIANANFEPQRNLLTLAQNQLGTVGSGNHYIDLFADSNDNLWIGVHFGSRGFGHKTATGFIAMSQGLAFTDHGKEGAMDSAPILLDINTDLGQAYIEAMSLAGEYAYAGRNNVVNKVLEILGGQATYEVHNHHNFAWNEEHYGENYWVVRKGCTPAFPGQAGFVGANMSDVSVILEGVDNETAAKGLYSTVHGAGRILSRRAAAGKTKWIRGEDGVKRNTVVAKGCVDFDEVKQNMKNSKIELRGAGADEAPQCYKNLEEVLEYQGDTVRILEKLYPIGVAMAGNETYDPYKD
jgi:tRNA-splicing ligase RtcB (3'-phosphate/5'-hydroxy nucleic acid ligase)